GRRGAPGVRAAARVGVSHGGRGLPLRGRGVRGAHAGRVRPGRRGAGRGAPGGAPEAPRAGRRTHGGARDRVDGGERVPRRRLHRGRAAPGGGSGALRRQGGGTRQDHRPRLARATRGAAALGPTRGALAPTRGALAPTRGALGPTLGGLARTGRPPESTPPAFTPGGR